MDAGRWADGVEIDHPGRPAPWLVWAVRHVVRPFVRVFHRASLEGLEHLPEGPFLLVANHSAGLGVSEILAFAALYLEQAGSERRLAAFAHPLGFRVYPFSKLIRAVGAVPSSYAHAEQALSRGVPLLLFPGGDHETLRPVWQADRVDFGGRVGFLRIARAAQVPIVPLGIRGSHWTAPMLVRSRALATLLVLPRLVGQKRWGISVLGVLGAVAIAFFVPVSVPLRALLAWVWIVSALQFLPWVPATIRMRIGPPIAPEELFADRGLSEPAIGSGRSDPALQRALARVEGAVQGLVRS